MAKTGKGKPKTASGGSALFSEGWLDRQLNAVVTELAGRDPKDQPRLTGARAAEMTDPSWLRVAQG